MTKRRTCTKSPSTGNFTELGCSSKDLKMTHVGEDIWWDERQPDCGV